MKEVVLAIVAVAVFFTIGLLIGERSTDQKTWEQCQSSGTAKLSDGHWVLCAPAHMRISKVIA